MKIRELGVRHFDDEPTMGQDSKLGDELSNTIGDLFIDSNHTPLMQWRRVAKAIRVHGLKLIESEEADPNRARHVETLRDFLEDPWQEKRLDGNVRTAIESLLTLLANK